MTSIYDITDWEQLIHHVDKDDEERVRVKTDKLVVAAFYELFSVRVRNWNNLSESERNNWATGIKEELEDDCKTNKLHINLYSLAETSNKKINSTSLTSSDLTESACNYIINYLAYLLTLNLYKNRNTGRFSSTFFQEQLKVVFQSQLIRSLQERFEFGEFLQKQTVGGILYEAYLNDNRMCRFSCCEQVYRYWRNFIFKKLIKYSEKRI